MDPWLIGTWWDELDDDEDDDEDDDSLVFDCWPRSRARARLWLTGGRTWGRSWGRARGLSSHSR